MAPLAYLALRLIRHQLPSSFIHQLMRVSGVLLQQGLETRNPQAAANRYLQAIEKQNRTLQGKRLLVFGYGGYLGLADALLKMDAKHVTLIDPYAGSYKRENMRLATPSNAFILTDGKKVFPNPEYLTLHHKPINEVRFGASARVDFVFSSSVYEHLVDPLEVTRHLAQWTNEDGCNVHFIDLRDHFFGYPFEMLSYSEATWMKFLNPSSHLNRYRIRDYENVFQNSFDTVEFDVLEHDYQAYRKNVRRIRQEYISGVEARDAATKIIVFASLPKHPA